MFVELIVRLSQKDDEDSSFEVRKEIVHEDQRSYSAYVLTMGEISVPVKETWLDSGESQILDHFVYPSITRKQKLQT